MEQVSIQLLSKTQAATWLDISVQTLDRLIDRGEVSTIRVGRRVRFTPEQLNEYLQRSTVRATYQAA